MVPPQIIHLLEAEYTDKKTFNRAVNLLKRPQNIFKKKLILKLSNGKKKVFQSFRIQHNDARGPFMGGTVYSKDINEDQIKKKSFEETIKSSISNLPFGGGFGGIDVDLSKLTLKDVERLTKNYSQFLTQHVGTWKDILATNVGTSTGTQNWMMDAYEKKKKFHSPATFVTNNNHLDGAVYILQEYLKINNISSRFRKLDVAVCGFGERAHLFLSNLNIQNFRIVALSDSTGGIVNSNGFNIEDVKKLKDKFSTLKEVSAMMNIEFITNEKLLELPVDILAIATDKKINAKNMNAKLILELGNCEIDENYIGEILPSLLLNSGFNVLNHLSWIQKMHGYNWSREEVVKKLHLSMTKIFMDVKRIVDDKKINYKDACLYLGTKRTIDAMMERGRV